MSKGIDVSSFQNNIDWNKVKNAGIDFAIIRSSWYKDGVDTTFEQNYGSAKTVGMSVGAYHFFYAVNMEEALAEADHLLQVIKGKQFEYPIYLDVESNNYQNNIDKETLTDMAVAFLNKVESAGYYVGIYSNLAFFSERLDDDKLQRFCHWVAQYNSRCDYTRAYQIWQNSSSGVIDGITGNVDTDICTVDYPTIIKNSKLNGCSSASVQTVQSVSNINKVTPQVTTYTVQSGDNLSKIASKFNTTWQALAQLNGLSNPNLIYTGQVLKINSTVTQATTYTVKAGDTLSAIANKYNTTYQAIAAKNGISNPNKIYPGQVLKI